MEKEIMYKPLPESVTINQSGINGLGLIAAQKIMKGTNLGMSHIKIADQLLRTPLGGFINHSNTPNCSKAELLMKNDSFDYKKWNLVTIEDVKEGEELTVRYTFYDINDELNIKNTISFKDGA